MRTAPARSARALSASRVPCGARTTHSATAQRGPGDVDSLTLTVDSQEIAGVRFQENAEVRPSVP